MPIGEIARTDVVTVPLDAPVDEVGRTMREENVGSVVVLDGGKPRGIVTDRDVAVYATTGDRPITELDAGNLMDEDLLHVDPEDGVRSVLRQMRERTVRRVPVTRNGSLVGIVTLDDIVVLLSEELEDLAAVIRAESPPY
jgi:CBS domain-containing protein